MPVSRIIARPLLGSIFFVGGYNALRNPEPLRQKARRVTDLVVPAARERGISIPDDPDLLVRANAVTQIVAAAALASGRAPRMSATVLAGTLLPTTVAGHAFWEETDPTARKLQKVQFAKNLSVLGGLLLAAVDTEGRPGVAWRTRHAAHDARRQARWLARSAKRELRSIT